MKYQPSTPSKRVVRIAAVIMLPLLIGIPEGASAQPSGPPPVPEPPDGVEQIIENAAEEGADDPELQEQLEYARRHPLNLATVSVDELASLPGISRQTAAAIVEFVRRTSPRRIEELRSLPTVTPENLALLHAVARLDPVSVDEVPQLHVSLRTRAAFDLQPHRGYRDERLRIRGHIDRTDGLFIPDDTIGLGPTYLGSPISLYTRLGVEYGRISAGILFEKDAGEPLLADDTLDYTYVRNEQVPSGRPAEQIDRRLGAFVGGYLTAEFDPLTLHVGDYRMEFGQGLLLGGTFGGYKGGDVIDDPGRDAGGIRSYRSATEYGFHRGLALSFRKGEWLPEGLSGELFVSHRHIDASFTDAVPDGDTILVVSSIRENGYRRTPGELRRSGNLAEQLYGGHARFRTGDAAFGFTAFHLRYSSPLLSDNSYGFSGSQATLASLDMLWDFREINLFGEVARSGEGNIGGAGGVSLILEETELTAAGRYLPAAFYSPYGLGFGESPRRQRNEYGCYLAARSRPMKGVRLSAYIDVFRFPESTGSLPFPGSGLDGMLALNIRPAPRMLFRLRVKSERKSDALTAHDENRELNNGALIFRTTTSARCDIEYSLPRDRLRLRGRLERKRASYSEGRPAANGILSYLDLRYRPISSLTMTARGLLFRNDAFDAAIYEFESDLPGRLTGRALSGEGARCYLVIGWRPGPNITISAKYAETFYADREQINPGTPEEIAGSLDNDLALQFDLSW